MAPVPSKLATLPFNCYELAHPWHPNCNVSACMLGGAAFKEGIKIYTTVYVMSLIVSRKIPKTGKDLYKLFTDVIRSSAFLGSHGFLFLYCICLLRKIRGNFNFFTSSFIPSFVACYISIFIEKPQRRPLLALYVTNVACETMYRMLRARGFVRDIAHFDLALFCSSMIATIFYMKKGDRKSDLISSVLQKIFGPEEFTKNTEQRDVINVMDTDRRQSTLPRRISLGGPGLRVGGEEAVGAADDTTPRTIVQDTYRNRFIHFVLWMHKCTTDIASHLERMVTAVYEGQIHEMCPHNQACFDYWMEGFYTRFLAGCGIHGLLQIITFAKKLFIPSRKPHLDKTGSLLSNSILLPCLKSGLGLGIMNLSFRLINCSFRWLKGADGPGHAAVAAFISSALGFFTLKPPNSLSSYVFFKALETAVTDSHSRNNWRLLNLLNKAYGGGWCLLYSISTALLFHASIFEPHNLKPSYYHFLSKSSGGKLYEFNRILLEIYGTNSALLVKDYWPKLDSRYLSHHMQDLLKFRETVNNDNEALKAHLVNFAEA